jgi:hypothetical protein
MQEIAILGRRGAHLQLSHAHLNKFQQRFAIRIRNLGEVELMVWRVHYRLNHPRKLYRPFALSQPSSGCCESKLECRTVHGGASVYLTEN